MRNYELIDEAYRLFRNSQDLLSSDPFYEVLKQFLRSGKNCERSQLDLNEAVNNFNTNSTQVWQSRELSLPLQGQCGDKKKVTHHHVYSVDELNEVKLKSCSDSGRAAVDNAKNLADVAFESSLAVSRVETVLLLFLNDTKENTGDEYNRRRVYQIIGVLFKLLRTCSPGDKFAENILKWICTTSLNSLLLPSEERDSMAGRVLLLIQILRVHNLFISELIPLVQPPVLKFPASQVAFHQFEELYFALLSIVVTKMEDRAEFVNGLGEKSFRMSANDKSPDKFVFVDEFDNGTGVSLQLADLEEPNLIKLLVQFEISAVLSLISSDSSTLDPSTTYAFVKDLVDLLFIGLSTYSYPPFRGFFKTLMFHLCEVLDVFKNHGLDENYEIFFMKTFERFVSEFNCAFSILWVDLPYYKLSTANKIKIICLISDFAEIPESDFLKSSKEFSDALLRRPLHDTAYLLKLCLTVISAGFTDDCSVVSFVVTTVLWCSHLLPTVSDVIWKIAKAPFCAFLKTKPSLINTLIEVLSSHIAANDNNSNSAVRSWLELSNFFKSVDYSNFEPDECSWNNIENWLIHSDIISGEYLVAKDIIYNMAWAGRGPGLPSFLRQGHHHRCAIVLLRWVSRSNLPTDDRKIAWSIMLRLNLINRNPREFSEYSVADTAKHVKNGEPLASYAAFLMSPTIASSIEAFSCQGLPLIRLILDKRYPNEAIYALLMVIADYYSGNESKALLASKDFVELIDRILSTSVVDMITGWAFEASVPRDVLVYGIVKHMKSMNAYMVLEFWLLVLGRCSEGFQKPQVMDAIELLLSLTPALPDGLSTLSSVLSKHYTSFVESARKRSSPVRTLVSWLVGLPFSLAQSAAQTTRWPWFSIISLSRDLQTEFESNFSLRFKEKLFDAPSSNLDKIFKLAMAAMEEGSGKKRQEYLLPTSAENMAIFRLAQFVSQQASSNHASTPFAWLLFFRAFLRKPTWSSKGCGFLILQQHQQYSSKKQLLPMLYSALNTTRDAMASASAVSEVARECYSLYTAMNLWLEEPRLHSENFDAKNLPPAFLPEIVSTLLDPSTEPWPGPTLQMWLTRFVDLQQISEDISLFANKFKASLQQNTPVLEHCSLINENSQMFDANPAQFSYSSLPDFSKYTVQPLFPDITDAMVLDFSTSLQILMTSLDAIRVFSGWVSEQESMIQVAYEKIIEILPNLYVMESVEERITKPCNTLTSYIRPCSNPAVLVARYRKTKRVSSNEIAINQSAAEMHTAVYALSSLTSPTACQAPVQVSVSAIRLEALISRVIETEGADETGRSLYYTIATFLDNNPSMRNSGWDTFLSQCLELLGQTFIRNCKNQQREGRGCLLETILNTVKSDYVRRLMISDFVPCPLASPGLLDILATAINAEKVSPDFAFLLMSKFEVKIWIWDLTTDQISALLGSVLRCVVSCLSRSGFSEHMLVDMLISMVDKCLSHNYPEMLHAGIEKFVLLAETYPNCVLPENLWNLLLLNVLGSSEPDCPPLSVDGPLSLQMIDQELHHLTEVFAKLRIRFQTSPAWKSTVGPLALISSRLYCLAVDRTVIVARVTAATSSSFDMFKVLLNLFTPLVSPIENVNPNMISDLRPAFAAFGNCLLHLQNATNEVRFANTVNLFSRILQLYLEEMLEAASIAPYYAKEIHTCLGRLQWSGYVPLNVGQVELLEMLCSRDGVSSFWIGVACSVDWKMITKEVFTSRNDQVFLISSLVRMGYASVVRCPRHSPLGDLVSGTLVDTIRHLDLEMLPLEVYTQLCRDVRSVEGRPLPPQVVFAWASKVQDKSLDSLKDCLVYLEAISSAFNGGNDSLTENSLARSEEFIRLVGLLLFDCLLNQSKKEAKSSEQVSEVIAALCQRCEVVLSSASSSSRNVIASRICSAGLDPLNQSVAFANLLLPSYSQFFLSTSEHNREFTVYWLSATCRCVKAAFVSVLLFEPLLQVYRQFSPGFTWETAQTLVNFSSCQSTPVATAPNQAITYSSLQEKPDQTNELPRTTLDEFVIFGSVAANNDAFLVVQVLARRAFTAVIEGNFESKKTVLFTFSDILTKCCNSPKKGGEETRLLGLWSLWLNYLVEMEDFLSKNGISSGLGYNSLALDLSFVARLSPLLRALIRFGESRSSKGIFGAFGFGEKSALLPWFQLFARGTACLLTKYYPECMTSNHDSKSSGSITSTRRQLDALSSLRSNSDYSSYHGLVIAIFDILRDNTVSFSVSVERLLTEFRTFYQ